jgi:flavin-dependent dehydrogenase
MRDALLDAAIIGAGPAGSGAAIALARRGFRVGLFEARRFPHDKVCGEFLSPECAGLVAVLELDDRIRALCPAPVDRVKLTAPAGAWPDGTSWEERLPQPGWRLSRQEYNDDPR